MSAASWRFNRVPILAKIVTGTVLRTHSHTQSLNLPICLGDLFKSSPLDLFCSWENVSHLLHVAFFPCVGPVHFEH